MDQPLKNPRHEKFAQLRASGMSAVDAYGKAGYSTKRGNAEKNAWVLERDKKGVAERILFLKKDTAKRFDHTRDELAQHLWNAAVTPVGEIDENHALSQEVVFDAETGATVKVKGMGKVESARLLCDILGWKEPEKHVHEDGPERIKSARERAEKIASPFNRLADRS